MPGMAGPMLPSLAALVPSSIIELATLNATTGESSVQPYPSTISNPVRRWNLMAISLRSFSAPVTVSRSDLKSSAVHRRI